MKNFRTFALAAGLLATASTAFAGNGKPLPADACANLSTFSHKAYVAVNRPERLNVIVTKAEAEPVKVRIKDADGNEIYRTAIKPEAALLPLNISQLEAGIYTVEFSRCNQTETETFTIK